MKIFLSSVLILFCSCAICQRKLTRIENVEIKNDSTIVIPSDEFLIFYIKRLQKVNIVGKINDTTRVISINGTRADTLLVSDIKVAEMYGDSVGQANFYSCEFSNFIQLDDPLNILHSLIYSYIREANFYACVFKNYQFNLNLFNKLTFIRGEFRNEFSLDNINLPDTLDFWSVRTDKRTNNLQLNFFSEDTIRGLEYNIDYPKDRICKVSFWNVDIDKFDFRYDKFHLYFPVHIFKKFEDKVVVFQQLLNNFKSKGQFQSYEKLDKEFREFKYTNSYYSNKDKWYHWIYSYGFVFNWFDRIWWDYGYNKVQVVLCSIGLCFIFFIFNLKYFPSMVKDGYKLERFHRINEGIDNAYFDDERKKIQKKIPYIFLYTCYIFWGWKLDLNIMNVKKKRLFAYILLQYLVGIICLAYIANFILTVRTVNI